MTRIWCAVSLVGLLAFAIVGCGGNATGTSTGTQGGESAVGRQSEELTGVSGVPEPEGGVVGVLRMSKVGGLGSIVIDRGLHTVYVFSQDSGKKSSCYEACATRWPPMITETNPVAMPGIDASKLGTTKREDGFLQVTYAGHPLYDYLGDTAAAEANGNDINSFGGQWHVIGPDGEELPGPAKGAGGVVFGAKGVEVGLILYDISGHTLYTFDKDKGAASTCYGACAKSWPPALTEGKPRAEGVALPGKVGMTKRSDGTIQMTYAGHPLYTHVGDEPVEITGGEAFGGEWYGIRPSGEKP